EIAQLGRVVSHGRTRCGKIRHRMKPKAKRGQQLARFVVEVARQTAPLVFLALSEAAEKYALAPRRPICLGQLLGSHTDALLERCVQLAKGLFHLAARRDVLAES